MAKVTYANIFSETRNNVVSLISNTANVADPTISSSEYRKWIYSRAPDVKDMSFAGYPLIIVEPVKFNTESDLQSGDMKHKFVNFNIVIEIRTSDRGYGSKDGQGLTNMDAISNDIVETFNKVANRASLSKNTLAFCNVQVEDVEAIPQENELIYRREVVLSFRNRMAISV